MFNYCIKAEHCTAVCHSDAGGIYQHSSTYSEKLKCGHLKPVNSNFSLSLKHETTFRYKKPYDHRRGHCYYAILLL